MKELSLIIPCRDERDRLPGTLEVLSGWMDGWGDGVEVVVVVERSWDGTEDIVREVAKRDGRFRGIYNAVARGKGYAVKTGMLAGEGRWRFFMDVDLSVPLRFVGDFLRQLEDGADVVFGSRRHCGSRILRSQSLGRVLAGRFFNWCLRLAGATRYLDTQCGFKAFAGEAADWIFRRQTAVGFGFDVEVLALAEVGGFRVVESAVDWCDGPGSKVRALRDGLGAFWEAVRCSWRARIVYGVFDRRRGTLG